MDDLSARLAAHRRSAWLPVTVDGDGPVTASKFAGRPWLAAGEAWPSCGRCGQPMQLFVQLDLAELPPPLTDRFGRGLLQLFYCTNERATCEDECQAWEPWGESKLARLVKPLPGTEAGRSRPPVPVEGAYSPKLILAWEEVDDYPEWGRGRGARPGAERCGVGRAGGLDAAAGRQARRLALLGARRRVPRLPGLRPPHGAGAAARLRRPPPLHAQLGSLQEMCNIARSGTHSEAAMRGLRVGCGCPDAGRRAPDRRCGKPHPTRQPSSPLRTAGVLRLLQ